MAKTMSFTQFEKTHGVSRKKLYKLTEKPDPPDFLSQDSSGRWSIDAASSGAKRLIKESGTPTGNPVDADHTCRRGEVRKARADKIIYDAAIKKSRAEQEEMKTKKMIGAYIDYETMRYYFSFFQRAITDSYAGIKKASRDAGRLYKADKPKEAEKVLMNEFHLCFGNAIKALETEIEKDRS